MTRIRRGRSAPARRAQHDLPLRVSANHPLDLPLTRCRVLLLGAVTAVVLVACGTATTVGKNHGVPADRQPGATVGDERSEAVATTDNPLAVPTAADALDNLATPTIAPTPVPSGQSGVRVTLPTGAYTVTVHESRLAAGLQVPPAEFDAVNAFERYHRETSDAPYPHFDVFPDWTAALYDALADEYEFVLFVLANDDKPDALMMNGFTQRVRNDVTGLGIPQFDYTDQFAADKGRLTTIILFTSRDCLRKGPALHEIGHRWGMNLFDASWPWHNGFSNVGGQLGGFDTLTKLEDGTFEAKNLARPDGVFHPVSPGDFGDKNQIPFAPLELYAMGLASPDEVPDVTVLQNASWVDESQGIVSGTPRTFTVDEVVAGDGRPEGADVAMWGPRDPAFPEAPTQFSALAVLVSPTHVSHADWDRFLDTVRWLDLDGPDADPLYNFWEATKGRATIDFPIQESAIRMH